MRRNRQVIAIDHREVGELAWLDRAEIVLAEDEIGTLARVRDERILAADRLFVDESAADHFAGDGPVEGRERAVLIDFERVGSEAPLDAAVLDRLQRRHRVPTLTEPAHEGRTRDHAARM